MRAKYAILHKILSYLSENLQFFPTLKILDMRDTNVYASVSDAVDGSGKLPHAFLSTTFVSRNYPIPENPQEMIALGERGANEELVATAIAGVINIARSRHKSLEDLKAEVLADDNLLDLVQRRRLCDILAAAWEIELKIKN